MKIRDPMRLRHPVPPIHMCDMHDTFICVTCMTHLYVWHDLFMRERTCVTWHLHMCDMSHVWHDSFHICDMTHLCVTWLIQSVTWLIHVWHGSFNLWHDSFMCDMTHSICDMTHSLFDMTHSIFNKTHSICDTTHSICEMTHSCVTWLIHIADRKD